ncbi:MAG: division/cell wall cluster transcriptional repressor MraZ [Gammaproteobacteria bacterium]|nr:division/cell wall cluster transcriptional repressor MraZ [Gammaproteobacteria bacterium]MDG1951425.1 division/cell wall cluster transcriptional repressor MraZ [Gammaproteobacteria bacterium]MDG2117595.1 division/cell wall cluster transcriptional repressor MraZ [Gammaproteobacteria bacterium]|tara:strand:- start:3887 stop:4342 length:456 start_codon:yes stop_codon:yes gene_type:complete
MFRGINNVNLDVKGRLGLPLRYREQLTENNIEQLVITIDTNHKCLLLYPLREWDRIEREIESLSSFEQMSRRVKHLLIGHATDLDLDNNGRILIPRELRLYADLEKHISLVGQGKKLEIWDQSAWVAQRELWLSEPGSAQELPDKLRALPL